jgi:hypothetical protein
MSDGGIMMKRLWKATDARPLTPVGAVVRGSLAGAVGTLAMDLLLYGRYRKDSGKSGPLRWEFSADVDSWDQAPAPAQVGRRLYEGLFRRELPDRTAALVNNLMHWGFGIGNGALYGVLAGSIPAPKVRHGAAFGAGVWASGYVTLPAAGLYQPIWKYDRRVLAKDLSAHLVYGLSTAAAFRAFHHGRRP